MIDNVKLPMLYYIAFRNGEYGAQAHVEKPDISQVPRLDA
jgi:hypothetical protein